MSKIFIEESSLSAIGNAIREKKTTYTESNPVYSHTPNITDEGVSTSVYANSLTFNDVVTIPNSISLHVDLYYGTESVNYDYICAWEGNYPTYTAAANYSTSIIDKKGGGNKSVTNYADATLYSFDVDGDSVTFGFKSDSSNSYYGYYAIVTGIIPTLYSPAEMVTAIGNLPDEAVLESTSITANGTYTPEEGVDGFNSVVVEVEHPVATKVITANGTYTPEEGLVGFNPVIVNVAGGDSGGGTGGGGDDEDLINDAMTAQQYWDSEYPDDWIYIPASVQDEEPTRTRYLGIIQSTEPNVDTVGIYVTYVNSSSYISKYIELGYYDETDTWILLSNLVASNTKKNCSTQNWHTTNDGYKQILFRFVVTDENSSMNNYGLKYKLEGNSYRQTDVDIVYLEKWIRNTYCGITGVINNSSNGSSKHWKPLFCKTHVFANIAFSNIYPTNPNGNSVCNFRPTHFLMDYGEGVVSSESVLNLSVYYDANDIYAGKRLDIQSSSKYTSMAFGVNSVKAIKGPKLKYMNISGDFGGTGTYAYLSYRIGNSKKVNLSNINFTDTIKTINFTFYSDMEWYLNDNFWYFINHLPVCPEGRSITMDLKYNSTINLKTLLYPDDYNKVKEIITNKGYLITE